MPPARILSQLRLEGVRPGVYGPGLDRKAIAQRALRELEELSWMSINLYGTRLEVVVREAVESPEIVDDEGFYDVVSEADGIITQVEPLAGPFRRGTRWPGGRCSSPASSPLSLPSTATSRCGTTPSTPGGGYTPAPGGPWRRPSLWRPR